MLESHILTSSQKDDALCQNEVLMEELKLLKLQFEASIKKANDDAAKWIEEAQVGLYAREKEFGLRIASQAKELSGEFLLCLQISTRCFCLLMRFECICILIELVMSRLWWVFG